MKKVKIPAFNNLTDLDKAIDTLKRLSKKDPKVIEKVFKALKGKKLSEEERYKLSQSKNLRGGFKYNEQEE